MKRIRDKFVGIWLTEEEKKELEIQANIKGLLPSTFIRMLLLDKINAENQKNSQRLHIKKPHEEGHSKVAVEFDLEIKQQEEK